MKASSAPRANAERHVREALGVDHAAHKAMEETPRAARPRCRATGCISAGRRGRGPIAVAAGAAQSDDLPIVDDLGARLGKEHGTDERAAVRVDSQGALV